VCVSKKKVLKLTSGMQVSFVNEAPEYLFGIMHKNAG
jgi:hypothetical protein